MPSHISLPSTAVRLVGSTGLALLLLAGCIPDLCGDRAGSDYGIIVSANPTQIPANGQTTSTITATLRRWKSGDTTTPTGAPVVNKLVRFSSSVGTLVGANPRLTDLNGQATIQLRSTTWGLAGITASVDADAQQAQCTVEIVQTAGGS